MSGPVSNAISRWWMRRSLRRKDTGTYSFWTEGMDEPMVWQGPLAYHHMMTFVEALLRERAAEQAWLQRGEEPMCVACGQEMTKHHDCGAY